MKSHSFIVLFASLALGACATTTKSYTARTTDISGPAVVYKPIIVDLNVGNERVEGYALGEPGANEEAVRQQAVADALQKSKADILIEPRFETQISSGRITSRVRGFPGYYLNFRQVNDQDLPLLQPALQRTGEKPEVIQPTPRKSNTGKVVGITLLSLIGITLGIAAIGFG